MKFKSIATRKIIEDFSLFKAMKRDKSLTNFKDLMIRLKIEPSLLDDAAIPPAEAIIKSEISKAMQLSIENLIINGDKEHLATQTSSDATEDNWYAHDHRLMCDGLVKKGFTNKIESRLYYPLSSLIEELESNIGPDIGTSLLRDAGLILIPEETIEYNYKEIDYKVEGEALIVSLPIVFNIKEGTVKIR